MNKQKVSLSVEFITSGWNLDTVEPTWLVEMRLGGLKIQTFKYYGKSESQAIKAAKNRLKELCN